MSTGLEAPERLVTRARAGDREALGLLLEQYRHYLRLLAQAQLGRGLRVRVDASDLVQETLLEAHRDFPQFAGSREGELTKWLRQILVRNLADQLKHHHSRKRDFEREESLEQCVERTHLALAAPLSTPSAHASQREQAVLLAQAMSQLSPDHCQVISLRHLEGLSFDAIGRSMGRSAGAVRMLWMRALERLGALMENS